MKYCILKLKSVFFRQTKNLFPSSTAWLMSNTEGIYYPDNGIFIFGQLSLNNRRKLSLIDTKSENTQSSSSGHRPISESKRTRTLALMALAETKNSTYATNVKSQFFHHCWSPL